MSEDEIKSLIYTTAQPIFGELTEGEEFEWFAQNLAEKLKQSTPTDT